MASRTTKSTEQDQWTRKCSLPLCLIRHSLLAVQAPKQEHFLPFDSQAFSKG